MYPSGFISNFAQGGDVWCQNLERGHVYTTVEPLNNGHIGTDHYREVVLFQRQKRIATM